MFLNTRFDTFDVGPGGRGIGILERDEIVDIEEAVAPGRVLSEAAIEDAMAGRDLGATLPIDQGVDPLDPLSPVDEEMASPFEVMGSVPRPDPYRPHRRDEQVVVCDPMREPRHGLKFKFL